MSVLRHLVVSKLLEARGNAPYPDKGKEIYNEMGLKPGRLFSTICDRESDTEAMLCAWCYIIIQSTTKLFCGQVAKSDA